MPARDAGTLSLERLRSLLEYDPETGIFIWRRKKARAEAGEIAGHRIHRGYIVISIDGRLYLAHRLAWFYANAEWPALEIDHINGRKYDNRIANLRDVPGRVNRHNKTRALSNNPTGLLGVHRGYGGKFTSCISHKGAQIHLGTFPTAELASAAYISAKRRLHEGCTL